MCLVLIDHSVIGKEPMFGAIRLIIFFDEEQGGNRL
jgi:hypothetical protein